MIYGVHLHLKSGEQSRFALPHLQFEQSPLHVHLISSLQDLETSGIVIQLVATTVTTLVLAKFSGEGTTSCVCVIVVNIPV